MAEAEPALYADLFELNSARMHLIALVLAHVGCNEPLPQGSFLLRASVRDVIGRYFDPRPIGIRRILKRLPTSVMYQEAYWNLVVLLRDFSSAKLLCHAPSVSEAMIRVLRGTPSPLMRFALPLLGRFTNSTGLAAGLHLLAKRGASNNFDTLVSELATAGDPHQFVAMLKSSVDRIPLPGLMPPTVVGQARRLDKETEVCAIGRRWQNCIEIYIDEVSSGSIAFYIWEEP